jgi:hypothetical protein
VRLLGCTAIGLALFAGGLTFLTYGIAQAVETGSCGTDEYGNSVGPPCPEGFGPMILLTILGAFVALGGAALFSARERGTGPVAVVSGLGKFFLLAIPGAGAAVVFGLVDLQADDTRPGREIVFLAAGLVLLVSVPLLIRGRRKAASQSRPALAGQLTDVLAQVQAQRAADESTRAAEPVRPTPAANEASPAAEPVRATPARAEEIAARLRQLDQLRGTGIMSDDEYAERRRQILSEL